MSTIFDNKKNTYGTMISELYSPNFPVLLKSCGFEFFIIDSEHGFLDRNMIAAMIATARGCGISPMVRVPKIDREDILKSLEMGAQGLMVPMVKTVADVEKVVEFARYAPLGNRGISTRRAHNGYDSSNLKEYMQTSNENISILIQIETLEALKNVEAIVKVPGITGLIIGPTDLSAALGELGNLDSKAFNMAAKKIITAAVDAKIHCGIVTSNIDKIKEYMSWGLDIISWNSEVGMIRSSAQSGLIKLMED